MFSTGFVFSPGKLTITLDGGAGSSGKGKLGSFLCEHADNWQFACNTFMPQAAHWVKLDDGQALLYQTFNSCAYLTRKYEKLYIAPGATIDLKAFRREIYESKIPPGKIGISAVTSVLQNIDAQFERGLCNFDGEPIEAQDGGYLAKTGTTAHGCGANRARRVLRHSTARFARDVPELREFICDVPGEIIARLEKGQAGLFEIAQGFQLSYLLPEFYPHTTSRNCTVAAGLDDLMVPPWYAGNVILNFRTYPIRINSRKYVDRKDGTHLTMDDVSTRTTGPFEFLTKEMLDAAGIDLIEGDSGPGYDDQKELTWDELTRESGSPSPLLEITSVTRLPRRVFSFSRKNVDHAVRQNRTAGQTYLSLNFANYVDDLLTGQRGRKLSGDVGNAKLDRWLRENLGDHRSRLKFIGTGARTDDMFQMG